LATVELTPHPITFGSYNNSFSGCARLNLASRKKLKDSGFTGEF
jgi:hypothetical protein